jgi:hypothetical protein
MDMNTNGHGQRAWKWTLGMDMGGRYGLGLQTDMDTDTRHRHGRRIWSRTPDGDLDMEILIPEIQPARRSEVIVVSLTGERVGMRPN